MPKAAQKPATAKPTDKSVARDAENVMPTRSNNRTIAHNCIAGCAGHDDFGPNTPLRNIPADPQCVQACVIQQTGKQIIVTGSDTEISIAGKLAGA